MADIEQCRCCEKLKHSLKFILHIFLTFFTVFVLYFNLCFFIGKSGAIQGYLDNRREDSSYIQMLKDVNSENLAVVTSYYKPRKKTNKGIHKLMRIFENIRNPVIFYTDDVKIGREFMDIRELSRLTAFTAVVILSRKSMWSHDLLPHIMQAYHSLEYVANPNATTERAHELTAELSKLNLVEDATRNNYFKNQYLCWIDFDYLHSVLDESSYVRLRVPDALQNNSVGVLKKNDSQPLNPFVNVLDDLIWYKSSLYVARIQTLQNFYHYYKELSLKVFKKYVNVTDQSKPMDSKTDQSKPMGSNIDQSKPIGRNTDQSKPMDSNIDQSKLMGSNIDQSKPTDKNTDQSKPMDSNIDQSKLMGSNIDQSKPLGSKTEASYFNFQFYSKGMINTMLKQSDY